ncbi:hypothetical protein L596_000118 [Steinernema carpocapsae]|uniref:C3HC-type domain-containing protein n=1 Tax=Steinernema carpocapsae TaxID=34508 RepID=A0A4U8UHY0_STECR|nr:hypothetical protein L596_000118 [Steinernema carpocapsae]
MSDLPVDLDDSTLVPSEPHPPNPAETERPIIPNDLEIPDVPIPTSHSIRSSTETLKRRAAEVMENVDRLLKEEDDEVVPPEKIARREVGDVDSTEKYNQRLKTYTISVWQCKPKELSPRKCAARGWLVTDRDILHCADCKAYLSAQVPVFNGNALEGYEARIQKLSSQLIDEHAKSCIWRSTSYREPLESLTPDAVFKKILARYESLENMVPNNFHCIKPKEITSAHLKKFDGKQAETVFMAICGWEYGGSRDKITCTKCHRVTSLFLFNENKPFEPLVQHFKWCSIFDVKTYPKWREDIERVASIKASPQSHVRSVMHIKMRMKEAFSHADRSTLKFT